MFDVVSLGSLAQDVLVALVALVALVVVLRRVLGVFETRPSPTATSGAAGLPAAGPSCSHCAAKTATPGVGVGLGRRVAKHH